MNTNTAANMSMNTSYAKGLVKNYADNQWTIINQVFGPDYDIKDSRSVWLSLDTLKAFIDQIQQSNPTSKTTSGIRIYFGAYSAAQPNPDNDYDHLHTLLLMPTYLDGITGLNTDYDATTGSSDFANLSTIAVMNHGSLIPPPFDNTMYHQGDVFMDYADNH